MINRLDARWASVWIVALAAACGGNPSAPSGSGFQVTFTSQAPDRCAMPCLRLRWTDQSSVTQGLLKLAVDVQNIPARGLSSVQNILTGKTSGTFSEPSKAAMFSTWNAGNFFERIGKPVRYEVDDAGTVLSNCCLTTYSVGFPTPAATDRASGDGTVVVLIYKLREAGTIELEPGLGLLEDLLVTTYAAQVRVVKN